MSDMKRIRVVAALVRKDGRILITRRPSKSDFGGFWEFPGGKVEPGETDSAALVRELMEEMSFPVEPGDLYYGKLFEYERFILDFQLYNCRAVGNEISLHGISDYAWVLPGELAGYRFPPADTEVVALLALEGGPAH
jgi:8-oxo-dGTP diphosphatase